MSGLNYLKLGSTLSNICNTTQLDNATKCRHAFKNFWGEPCSTLSKILMCVNFSPNDKILDVTILEASAEGK